VEEITIQEFGGEVKFTKYIADQRKVAEKLLNAIDLDVEDFTITPEEKTLEDKRVDLVVRDPNNNVIQVIECQDASGWLDPVHASKILWYSDDKKCDDVVIITEDMTEDMRNFVIRLNKESWVNIYVIQPTILKQDDGKPFITFKAILRPTSWSKKIVRANNPTNASESPFAEFMKAKYDENRDMFDLINTSSQRCYVACSVIGSTGMKVLILRNTKGFKIQLHHHGLHDTETFRETVKQQYPEAKFNTYASHTYADTWEDAFDMYKNIVEFINNGTIRHT